MNRGMHVLAAIVLAMTGAFEVGAQAPPRRAAGTPQAGSGGATVARVGQHRIGRDELDAQTRQAFQLYRDRNRVDIDPQLEPLVRRQVLENLIRQRLLALDAERRGVTVSDEEAEAQVRLDPAFQQDGMFNEAKYLAIKAANPEAFAEAMAGARAMLAARKASERMERETRPDDAAIRAELERELARVSLEYLALRTREFDGSYPEPREAEILGHYRSQGERYRRPEEAHLSVILVHRPEPDDSVAATHAGYRAWEQRMRRRADSLLSALRSGARFEDLALLHGGIKDGITLSRGQLPEFWRGSSQEVAAALGAAPGSVLPQPVRAAPGWAVVRVDRVVPAHIAPLREVAREIRAELRSAARARSDEQLLREIYAAIRDSLRGEGYRVRYAVADVDSFESGEPGARDLDRYYRAHLAEYSTYDRASGTVVETPLVQVRDEVRRRWMRERRAELARQAAERLHETWERGRRNPGLEAAMTRVREVGPVPASGPAGGDAAEKALADALAGRRGRTGVGMIAYDRGHVVYDLLEVVPGYVPTFEQARVQLDPQLEQARAAATETAARRLYDADPSAFMAPARISFSRLVIEPPSLADVELTRDEVERFHRSRLNEFSVSEIVRVRHILITPEGPGAEADAAARAEAERLLARVRAGEDFAGLAAEFSDDPATRLKGGDVGVFRRGQMREAFERAAFAMRPGDVTGPVRTEVGYHILECLEYLPPIVHPLDEVYANVAWTLAGRKAQRIATERADSLFRTLKSVAHAKEVAARHQLEIIPNDHDVGHTGRFSDNLLPYIQKVETLKPGEFYPGTQTYTGLGEVITWVDAIRPPRPLPWEEARDLAVERTVNGRIESAVQAKKAELDSMMAAGWSFDSIATLWGGLERLEDAARGSELRGLDGRAVLDSLAFGGALQPVLKAGTVSPWIVLPRGEARIRLTERIGPDPADLARRVELRRQLVLWRNLNEYFGRLKNRYPVEILDGELRATTLPEPTES